MKLPWTEKILQICEELSPQSSASIVNKLKSIDADFFSKWNIKDLVESHGPEKLSFTINTDKLKLKIEIIESEKNSKDKYDLYITDSGNGILNKKSEIFLEDSMRVLNTMINTKSSAMNEYEKGDLKAISDKSRANLSNDTKSTSTSYDSGEIEDISDIENKSKSVQKKKPIGTNSNVVDAAARTVGSGILALRGQPKKMSDFVKHMRAQIPDFDNLVRQSPRFIQGVRKVDSGAERDLKKITNDTN